MSRVERLEDVAEFVAPVVLAFGGDPFVRWLLPSPARFLATFTEVTRLHAQRTVAHAGAWGLEGGRGAAFWYPPGIGPDSAALSAAIGDAGAGARVAAVFGEVAPHQPDEPHWYLRLIGVDPALQGRGLGSALLTAALDEIDGQRMPAYLEATSAASVALYRRHGFAVLAEISVDGSAPLWPMLRLAH